MGAQLHAANQPRGSNTDCDRGRGNPGPDHASADLLPLVYKQLRALARRKMRDEAPDQTLQPTALVHEAYVRLMHNGGAGGWANTGHFFVAAAEAMRRILVERARKKSRRKHGGRMRRVELNDRPGLTTQNPHDELLALDEALALLTRDHPQKAQLVKLRYFAGLTTGQAAEALGISLATAERHWSYARAWLYRLVNQVPAAPPCHGREAGS
jgi:RNA polymerase sigma factor (TIGR02999 family)